MRFLSALLLSLSCISSFAYEAIVLGDSLSDQGRAFELSQGVVPAEPNFDGRFSNGPVWAEHAFATPILNFAVGGAYSDEGNLFTPTYGESFAKTGFLSQLDELFAWYDANSDQVNLPVYILVGSNDFLKFLEGRDSDERFRRAQYLEKTLMNIVNGVDALRAKGVSQITVIGLPNLALTPLARENGPIFRRKLEEMSLGLNKNLAEHAAGRYTYFDLEEQMSVIFANPASEGFLNITEACFNTNEQTICDNPDAYFFWDHVHPTTAAHAWFAERIKASH